MPWPSFLDVHAKGDETRPLPWPSFRVIYSYESPSDAVMKLSWQGTSHRPPTIICDDIEFQILAHSPSRKGMDDMVIQALGESTCMKPFAATLVQSMEKNPKVTSPLAYSKLLISDLCGNLFTSTGCIIIHDLCNSSEWRCLHYLLLFLEYWRSASDCVQSVHTTVVWPPCYILGFPLLVIIRSIKLKPFSNRLEQSLILDSFGRSDSSYGHCSSAFWDASHWPEYFVTGVYMHVSVTSSVRHCYWLVLLLLYLF